MNGRRNRDSSMSSGSRIRESRAAPSGKTFTLNGPPPIDASILFSCLMEVTIRVRSCAQAVWHSTSPAASPTVTPSGPRTIAASLQRSEPILLETGRPPWLWKSHTYLPSTPCVNRFDARLIPFIPYHGLTTRSECVVEFGIPFSLVMPLPRAALQAATAVLTGEDS